MQHCTIFSLPKNLENIRESDLPDSHALKNQLEIITGELIELRQANKKQQNTLNIFQKILNNVENLLEQLCSGNGQQKSHTASNNTYKGRKKCILYK